MITVLFLHDEIKRKERKLSCFINILHLNDNRKCLRNTKEYDQRIIYSWAVIQRIMDRLFLIKLLDEHSPNLLLMTTLSFFLSVLEPIRLPKTLKLGSFLRRYRELPFAPKRFGEFYKISKWII